MVPVGSAEDPTDSAGAIVAIMRVDSELGQVDSILPLTRPFRRSGIEGLAGTTYLAPSRGRLGVPPRRLGWKPRDRRSGAGRSPGPRREMARSYLAPARTSALGSLSGNVVIQLRMLPGWVLYSGLLRRLDLRHRLSIRTRSRHLAPYCGACRIAKWAVAHPTVSSLLPRLFGRPRGRELPSRREIELGAPDAARAAEVVWVLTEALA